jgi:hypothetical protein
MVSVHQYILRFEIVVTSNQLKLVLFREEVMDHLNGGGQAEQCSVYLEVVPKVGRALATHELRKVFITQWKYKTVYISMSEGCQKLNHIRVF